MTSLAEIRTKLAQQDTKNQNNKGSQQTDNAIYPHWNMDEGTTASIRFVPDANPQNSFFWVERAMIKLPFNGVKGNPSVKQTVIQVPCMHTYNEQCPIINELKTWYKNESLTELANKYWKKRTYLFSGFVRANPIADDKTPANPMRRFIMSPQLFALIKASLMDPEMEELPTSYTRGLDFNIKKTSKGGYADYSTSNWARKESAITEAEQAAIDAHGLFNLADFLPKKPTEAEVKIIYEMFEASVDGQAYDNDRWGNYYRPYGLEAPSGSTTNTASSTSSESTEDNEPSTASSPVVVTKPTQASSDKAADILAMIRSRQQAKNS
jgi:hypothetical protein